MDDEGQEFGERYGDAGGETTPTNDADYASDTEFYVEEATDETEEENDVAGSSPDTPAADNEEEAYVPPAYDIPLLSVEQGRLFTEEEREYYNELAMSDPAAAAEFRYQREQAASVALLQRMMQANAIHQTAYARAEQKLGEWGVVHGDAIRQTLATAAPAHSGTPLQQLSAIVAPLFYQVQQGADPADAVVHMARLVTRQGQKPGGPPLPTAPQPAAKVAPSGSRAGSGSAPGVGRPKNEIEELMQLTGMNRMDAEATLRGMQETGALRRRGGYR